MEYAFSTALRSPSPRTPSAGLGLNGAEWGGTDMSPTSEEILGRCTSKSGSRLVRWDPVGQCRRGCDLGCAGSTLYSTKSPSQGMPSLYRYYISPPWPNMWADYARSRYLPQSERIVVPECTIHPSVCRTASVSSLNESPTQVPPKFYLCHCMFCITTSLRPFISPADHERGSGPCRLFE